MLSTLSPCTINQIINNDKQSCGTWQVAHANRARSEQRLQSAAVLSASLVMAKSKWLLVHWPEAASMQAEAIFVLAHHAEMRE
jgi:hypothetical protein